MSIRKLVLCAIVMSFVSWNSLRASDVGVDIAATTYSFESDPDDPFVIRDMDSKVGYVRAVPESYAYWGYESFDFGDGATHLTVRVASATQGGTLHVRLASFYNPMTDLAVIEIPNTGGWNSFQDIKVPIDQEVLEWLGSGRSLLFVVESDNPDGYLFDIESFRFDNEVNRGDVGIDIAGAAYDFESAPEDNSVIRPLGDVVGFVRASRSFEYWAYENFDFGDGATTLTVRASSATNGGTLYVRLGNHYNPGLTVAVVEIPNTGGWDVFQEITVPVDPEVIAQFNGQNLFFVVTDEETIGFQFDIESFRFDNE